MVRMTKDLLKARKALRRKIGVWLGYGEVMGYITPIWLMILFQPYRAGLRLYWFWKRRGEQYIPLRDEDSS